jgi:chromosomal replication initiation ATPase DnaA
LYQTPSTSTTVTAPDIVPTPIDREVANAALVKNIISPQPQAPMMPGPKTGRGAVVDMYSQLPPPTQPAEWANRLPLDSPQQLQQLQQLQQQRSNALSQSSHRPSTEETGRFWMNKISLDLGVVLVAKVMKALERSQFLVLAAPGGYGKTSLLQLLERVYEKQGKCVVRFRILQDTDVYHQFQTSSGIDLKNAYIHDLRPNYQKVILIDDAHKVYDTPGFWEVLLKKFPTWCFAWDYTIIFAVTLPVVQGSPIIELLGDPTIPHLGPKDFVPDE